MQKSMTLIDLKRSKDVNAIIADHEVIHSGRNRRLMSVVLTCLLRMFAAALSDWVFSCLYVLFNCLLYIFIVYTHN